MSLLLTDADMFHKIWFSYVVFCKFSICLKILLHFFEVASVHIVHIFLYTCPQKNKNAALSPIHSLSMFYVIILHLLKSIHYVLGMLRTLTINDLFTVESVWVVSWIVRTGHIGPVRSVYISGTYFFICKVSTFMVFPHTCLGHHLTLVYLTRGRGRGRHQTQYTCKYNDIGGFIYHEVHLQFLCL